VIDAASLLGIEVTPAAATLRARGWADGSIAEDSEDGGGMPV